MQQLTLPPAVHLRTEFTLTGDVRRATVFASTQVSRPWVLSMDSLNANGGRGGLIRLALFSLDSSRIAHQMPASVPPWMLFASNAKHTHFRLVSLMHAAPCDMSRKVV